MDGVQEVRRAALDRGTIFRVLAVLCLLVGLGGVGAARPALGAPEGRVWLVSQTPWVTPGETLTLRLRTADVAEPEALEIAVTVHAAVKNRVELVETMRGQGLTSPLWPRANTAVPLPLIPAGADGTLSVQVPTSGAGADGDPARVRLRAEGIYPVQVELRELDGGDTVHRLTTHLLAVAPRRDGTRLNTAVVLPLSAPASTGLVRVPSRPPEGAPEIADAAAGLITSPKVPLTVAPTPEVLDALVATAPSTAAALRQALADRDVLGRPYVPVDVPGLGAAAAPLLPRHLTTGRAAAREVLGREPIGGIWLADEPLDGAALAQVMAAGATRLILPQVALGPTGPAVAPPLRPMTVSVPGTSAGPTEQGALAIVADGTLASGLDGQGSSLDQVLRAHHLLADLAALATLPADQGMAPPEGPLDRGVATVLADRTFIPTSAFLTELLGGLATSPVLRAVDLATAFAIPPEPAPPAARPRTTTTRRGRRGTTTTVPAETGRVLAPLPAGAVSRGIADVAGEAVWQLATIGQVLVGPPPANGGDPAGGQAVREPSLEELQRRMLVATSADLPIEQRRARLQELGEEAKAELADLKMAEGRTLRLTARTGQLPVGIFNDTGRTAKVLLQLESEKLDFPAGNTTQVLLDRRATTSQIQVRVRASGSFPVRVRLLTPDGSRVLQETEYIVRSNTLPGVAIVVSGGAAIVLAGWWVKTLLPPRRHIRRRWRRVRQPG